MEKSSLICSLRPEKRLRRSMGAAGRNASPTSRRRSRTSASSRRGPFVAAGSGLAEEDPAAPTEPASHRRGDHTTRSATIRAVRVSAKVDYALRAVIELAAASDGTPVKGERIAQAQEIPLKFLENIL